jgi:hypothetical protein
MNGLIRCARVLLAGALVETMMAGTAVAASGRTVYVDHHGTASAARIKGKCGKPNFATIRAAVHDVSVVHVVVCAGTYSEQVAVTRGVTLDGRPGAVIQAPACDGIETASGATDNTAKQNTVHGNGGTDILDANGVPLVNAYSGNTCDTSNPAGLCRR